jgi:hypothetical protein
MRATNPLAGSFALRTTNGAQHPGDESSMGGRNIPGTRLDGLNRDPRTLNELEKVLKLARRTVKSLRSPSDDRIDGPRRHQARQRLVGGPSSARESGDVVVYQY